MAEAVTPKKVYYPEIQNNVQVRHPKFGLGKVILRMGEGEQTSKAIVRFKEEGEKKLSLRYAKLVADIPVPDPAAPPVSPDGKPIA